MIINRSRKRKRRKEGRKKIRRQPVSFLRKLSVFIGVCYYHRVPRDKGKRGGDRILEESWKLK